MRRVALALGLLAAGSWVGAARAEDHSRLAGQVVDLLSDEEVEEARRLAEPLLGAVASDPAAQ